MSFKILCIDDEMPNLESLDRCLHKDYHILTASSGPDGLKILEREPVDLIISDQRMPDMTGVEFLSKSIAIRPEAMRILLTGYADLESVIDAINKGEIYRYVTKPWDPVELKNTVAQALDVYQMRETIRQQNAELLSANEQLKSLDKLKTDFMMLVNHELRTPLTAISSYTQLLQEDQSLKPDHKLYIEKIDKNCGRLNNLIKDTLLILRMKSSQKNIELKSLDVKKMIEKIWGEFASIYKDKGIKMMYHGKIPFLQMVNEEFLKIVLDKLVRNSFQHSADSATVEFYFSENKNDWTLRTSNPIAKKIDRTPEQLLNAFSKNENILNHTGGAGLGLAVINSIAQLFGANVDIKFDDKKFDLSITFPKNL